eukprot:g21600.t1
MLIGSFFVLNLCVGVIIDNYNKQKKESDIHFVLVTDVQAAWMTQMKAIYLRRTFFTQVNVDRLGPSRQHRFRRETMRVVLCCMIITSAAFENLIMACIVIQLCLLMMVWQPRDSGGSLEVFLDSCNVFFIVVFHIECFVKLSALYCNYFREYWNVFDFICVLTSDIVAILEASIASDSTVNLSSLVNALRQGSQDLSGRRSYWKPRPREFDARKESGYQIGFEAASSRNMPLSNASAARLVF